jgi:hypothetical protein
LGSGIGMLRKETVVRSYSAAEGGGRYDKGGFGRRLGMDGRTF